MVSTEGHSKQLPRSVTRNESSELKFYANCDRICRNILLKRKKINALAFTIEFETRGELSPQLLFFLVAI